MNNERTLELARKVQTITSDGMAALNKTDVEEADKMIAALQLCKALEPVLIELSELDPNGPWKHRVETGRQLQERTKHLFKL